MPDKPAARRSKTGQFASGGGSANPNGRPKNKTITEILRTFMFEKDDDGEIRAKKLANKLYSMGLGGDARAGTYIFDRLDGRPPQGVTVSGDPNAPLHAVVTDGSRRTAGDPS